MNNERFPHTVRIYRMVSVTSPFVDDDVEQVLYEGKCRNYAINNAPSTGGVITSNRIVAISKELDVLNLLEGVKAGDFVDVTMGGRTEYGKVLDVMPNNFGTDIIWEYGRN